MAVNGVEQIFFKNKGGWLLISLLEENTVSLIEGDWVESASLFFKSPNYWYITSRACVMPSYPKKILKKDNENRYNLKQGSFHTFECEPIGLREEAVLYLRNVPGISAAISGNQAGSIAVQVSSTTGIDMWSEKFSNPDWEVERIMWTNSDLFYGLMIPQSLIEAMNLTDDERRKLTMIVWIYNVFGKPMSEVVKPEDKVYILLSYDHLKSLRLHNRSSKNPKDTLGAFQHVDKNVFTMSFKDLFAKDRLYGIPIMNPLNYRPNGRSVLVVERASLPKVLSECGDEDTQLQRSVLLKFIDTWLSSHAEYKNEHQNGERYVSLEMKRI